MESLVEGSVSDEVGSDAKRGSSKKLLPLEIEAIWLNGDLSKWDTSSVTEMQNAFFEASSFNSDISGWSTSSVEYMSYMFYEATAFGRDLSAWDIGNVQFMYGMFQNAASLDEDLCAWADAFPYDNAGDIFAGSGCFFQDDPQELTKDPFVHRHVNDRHTYRFTNKLHYRTSPAVYQFSGYAM